MDTTFKRLIILTIFFISGLSLYCEENNQAKLNLKKAYTYFKNMNYELSKKYLIDSFEYSQDFPEYYYIDNLLMSKIKENYPIKRENSNKIIRNLNNYFFIEPYDLLKQAGSILIKVKDFEQGINSYERLILIKDRVKEEDFKAYIESLFISKEKKYLEKIPAVIYSAKKYFDSLDFDYYFALYKIRYDKINVEEFNRFINLFNSNYYPEMRILYLKILFLNDKESIKKIYNEYIGLKENNKIDKIFSKRIIKNLLMKSIHLQNIQKYNLLNDWLNIGLDDYKTIEILGNQDIFNIIKKDEKLNNLYLKYNGIKTIDYDEDGDWESFFEYKKGVIIKNLIDDNQDSIYELMMNYFDNGNIKEYVVFLNRNDKYIKYIFNEIDQSVNSICYYENNILQKKENIIKSALFLKTEEIKTINNNNILPYISSIEYWKEGYSLVKTEKNNVIYEKIDLNKNGIFEVKNFYKNNVFDEVYKDNNEDGNYELYEKYNNGKLKYIMFKTEEDLKNYDYKEEGLSDRAIKYWDNDHDGIFEIKIEDFYNGILFNMIDANYDGNYDLIYQTKGNDLIKIYRITKKGNIILKEFKPKEKDIIRKWRVVTINDIDKIIEPDDIIVQDKRRLTGVFYYKNKKYYFEKGLIKNEFFNYRLFFINNIIYMLDMVSF